MLLFNPLADFLHFTLFGKGKPFYWHQSTWEVSESRPPKFPLSAEEICQRCQCPPDRVRHRTGYCYWMLCGGEMLRMPGCFANSSGCVCVRALCVVLLFGVGSRVPFCWSHYLDTCVPYASPKQLLPKK